MGTSIPWTRAAALGLALLAGAPAPAHASDGGLDALLERLARLLPGEALESERQLGAAGAALGFGAPLKAGKVAEAALGTAMERLRPLAAALRSQGVRAATGPLHQELERRHVMLADVRALLRELAEATETASRALEPAVGSGNLVGALALEEILSKGGSNLRAISRSLRAAGEECSRARRALSRMLAYVEAIQEKDLSRARARVLLATQPGSPQRLVHGLRDLEGWLDAAREDVAKVRGLMRVRYLSLLEALRNLASHGKPERGLAGLDAKLERLGGARDVLVEALTLLEAKVEGLRRGDEPLPELPPLPGWLFTSGREPEPAPLAPERASEALALLDEIEAEIDAETQLDEDPLTALLAAGFAERHGLEP